MQTGSSSQTLNYNNLLYSINDVSVRFNRVNALSNINLGINTGEILFITGASGSGKTTLLRLLAGELKASSGKIVRYKSFITAVVFQDLRLLESFSIYDNLMISYNADKYLNFLEFEQDMFELIHLFNLTDRLNDKVSILNGGLKQKVAIIRALLMRADIILADEPTSSLDLENSKKIFELLHLYNVKRHLAVIWTSHNRELVKHFTGRIVHLDNGKLIYTGHACFI